MNPGTNFADEPKHIALMRLLRLFAATLFSHCVAYAAALSVRGRWTRHAEAVLKPASGLVGQVPTSVNLPRWASPVGALGGRLACSVGVTPVQPQCLSRFFL